jgi:tetratricopeptide (TPR) repeat protein
MRIPNDDLQRIESLQEQNLNLQAYELAKPFGPISQWEGTDALLLASHLAYSLGAPDESFRLTSRAWHRDKTHPKAIFYQAAELLQRRGPLPTLMFVRKFPDFTGDKKLTSWWYSLHGQLHATLRDFVVADSWHQKAIDVFPEEPWAWVSKAFSLEQQDRYEDALAAAQKGLHFGPLRRATVSATAYYLTLLERNDEARELLSRSIEKVENAWLVKNLADLQFEMGMHAEAYATMQKCFDLLPLIEPKVAQWFYGGLSDSAYLLGDIESAKDYAGKAENKFHTAIVENLKKEPDDPKRVQLDVRFLRQHHVTCAPATISNLARFWQRQADHLELVEEMCYDGTPSYKERIWAENNGWITREFTLNWDDATALLDRGVPLTLATIFPGGGHLQAIIGYDSRRRTYLVRDPYYEKVGEFLADELLENQKASGPRVMALVPEGSEELLTGIGRELFESDIYDMAYRVESALEFHKRDEAENAMSQLADKYPDHRLTLATRWVMAHYDANTPGIRSALQGLLKQFPDDVNLRLSDIATGAEFTGRAERLATLERYSTAKVTDPLMWQMFGYELGLDAKQHSRALHWLMKSVRFASRYGLTYRFIADVLWGQRRFEEAAELYRFASSLNDKDEGLVYAYFLAMRHLKREDEALATLADRFKRFGKQSGLPACSLFAALREVDRVEEALTVLDDAVSLRPDDGDLLLFAADAKARYGRAAQADELLRSAESRISRPKWLRTAARISQLKGDLESSLANWREVLAEDPSAIDAHENVAFLIKASEGSTAAKEHLRRACRKYPTNRSLHVLRLQLLNEEPGEAIAVLRDLIRLDPSDAWSWRELSTWYVQLGRYDRALEAAEKAIGIEPNDSSSRWFLGRALELLGKYREASEEYKSAIRLNADNGYAISSLLATSRTLEAKRQALAFIWEQLESQPGTGEGLFAYREEARRVVDRAALLQKLEDHHGRNRRSWVAPSAVVQQLCDMGRLEDAAKLAREATERFPLNNQTWLDLAIVARLRGATDGELEALKSAVSISPMWSYGVQQLADAYQRAGRHEQARDVLLDALTRMPTDNYLLGYLADSYWNLNERSKAIETAKQAIMIEPDYAWAWMAIKGWAQETGDHDLPVTLARELTEKKPKDVRAWVNLAEMLDSGAFSQERMDAVEQALKLDPFSAPALANKVHVLADARRFDEAVEVAQTKTRDGHRPEQLRFAEAGIEAMRGNNRRSIDILLELTESSPGYAPGWLRLAEIYRLDPERRHEYRKVAMEIVKLAPRDATAFGYLAEACLNLDLRDEAREALQQAVIIDPMYEFGVQTLFGMLIDSNDLAEAERMVEVVRGSSKLTGLPISVELAIAKRDRGQVLHWLRETLENGDIDRDRLEVVFGKVASFLGAKDPDLLPLLRDVCAKGDVNPAAARYLISASWEADKQRGAEKDLQAISANPRLWAFGAARLMEILAAEKPKSLRAFIDANSEKLAVETESWGAVGYQLTGMNDEARAEKWYESWRSRDDVMPWMLWNYSIVLRRAGHASAADAVNAAALNLRFDDTVNIHQTVLALGQFNEGNFDEASAMFAGVNPAAMNEFDRFFYEVLNESLWAHERIMASDTDAAKALIDSIVDKVIAFDQSQSDKMVKSLAGGAITLLLNELGNKWYSLRKRAKMYYWSLG